MTDVPRPEYPRPQFTRPRWLSLNGTWEFEIDHGDSGYDRDLHKKPLQQQITVPFCPESTLSGIGYTDFMAAVWYRRQVRIPDGWQNCRVLLHLQACDYDTTVWADGTEVARHRGGFTPITADLGSNLAGKTVTLAVRAREDHRNPHPRGKQCYRYQNVGCHYTRTTGIWQDVWLEPVPETYFLRPRVTPDVANSRFHLELPIAGRRAGMHVRARLRDAAGVVSTASVAADADFSPRLDLPVPASRRKLWEPGDGHLYDIDLELLSARGTVVDAATTYGGLRSIAIEGPAVLINGKPVFQRLVLDQGYYPDGIMTAPSDAALVRDIELSMAAGFNGARLHQKVFEERFLYHADRLGYLVWGEFADWGCSGQGPHHDHQRPGPTYITQWLEALQRDYSHPSIIGWCPLNETWQYRTERITVLDDTTRGMFLAAKAMDPTRPVLDTSGYSHRVPESDIYDAHDYVVARDWAKGVKQFRKRHERIAEGKPYANSLKTSSGKKEELSIPYNGQPYFISEFGGIWWNPKAKLDDERKSSWGYGTAPRTIEDFYKRFADLCDALLDNPYMFGYCYTQLTDVFQEENGIFTFDRASKFDVKRIAAIQQRPAAIETQRPARTAGKTGKPRSLKPRAIKTRKKSRLVKS